MNITDEKEAKQVELLAHKMLDAVDEWNHREDLQCMCGDWIPDDDSPKSVKFSRFDDQIREWICSTCMPEYLEAVETGRPYPE